jgi:hypothetical protein
MQAIVGYKFPGKPIRREIMVLTTKKPFGQAIDQILVNTRVFDAPEKTVCTDSFSDYKGNIDYPEIYGMNLSRFKCMLHMFFH